MKLFVLVLMLISANVFADNVSSVASKEIHELATQINKTNDVPCDIIIGNTAAISPTQKAVHFTLSSCGGGNHYEEYVLLLIKSNGGWKPTIPTQVGGNLIFLVDRIDSSNGKIAVYGKRWSSQDAHCCPSLFRTIYLRIEKEQIINDYHY